MFVRLCCVLLMVGCACQRPAAHPVIHGFRLLADGSYHRQDTPPAYGFYVLGMLDGAYFSPSTDVQGSGEIGESGAAAWLELADGSFHSSLANQAPMPPYVPGLITQDGFFAPASQRVIR